MNDLISIIIPLYNRQDVLEECIHSILTQSCQNYEILLIDDGSTDATIDIARSLAADDSRITLLTMEHGGVSAARNRGLEAAKGDYLFFVDSDDCIHPLLLETLLNGLKNSSASISGTGVVSINEKNWFRASEMIRQDPGPGETVFKPHSEAVHAIFHSSSPLNCIGGVMMRRSLVGDTRFDPALSIGEDFYFIYQNLLKGADVVFLKQKWYYARLHSANSSWNYGFDGFWSRFHRRELVWKTEEQLGRPENAAAQKRNAFSIFINCLLHQTSGSDDQKRTLAVMRQYRPVLFPGLSFRDKLRFLLSVYMPRFYIAVKRLVKKVKK